VLLGSVVALTLLIACANLANLMLARQLLIESLILATGGGAAGLYVATITLRLIARFQLPGGIDVENLPLDLNRTALLFTLGISTLTGMLFGIAPAWRAGRQDVMASLRTDTRTASGPSRLRSALVAAQVALSLVLLAGTGLFLRSLANVLDTHLGFRTEGVATATVNLGTARYDAARAKAFYDEALGRVRTVPGVTAAAWTNVIPITGLRMFTPDIEGYTKQGAQDSTTFYNAAVGPEYFQAAGTRLVSGRAFTADDTAAAPHVAIVNQEAVRRFWRDRDPLQGRLRLRLPRQQGEDILQVVGVVENTTVRELNEQVKPHVYLPFAQSERGAPLDAVHLLVRANGDPAPLLPQIQARLRSVDPAAPVLTLATFEWQIRQLVMPQRMGATLFGVFAGLALLLAAVGIYGVASYVTALRAREIGIRIALGADRTRIRALVLRQGASPIAAGIAAGLVLAVLGGRLTQVFLRGVTSRDPLTYAAVVAVLGAVALSATWLPARRAAALDPIRALRQD
jgi:putative ABC transport system permease protein